MYILVTLNPNQGVDLGPNFTLTANVGSLSPATATLTQLLAGVTVRADDGVSSIIVTSQGICTNSITLSVLPATTTTTAAPTTTTTTSNTTTTTTTAAPILCFNYFVYADDGTGDKNSYSYSYISCAGVLRSGARVNGGPGVTICAQEGTVTSESGFIFADEGEPCGTGTTTTTTTTTTPPVSLYRYSSAGFEDACSTGLTMTNVVLIDGTFCDATAIQCDEFLGSPAGVDVWVRSGNSYRAATINDPNPSGIATFSAGTCTLCPTTTTTTTTTAGP